MCKGMADTHFRGGGELGNKAQGGMFQPSDLSWYAEACIGRHSMKFDSATKVLGERRLKY